MNLSITSVDFSVTPEMREFIHSKFAKLQKYSEHIIDTQVQLANDHDNKLASVTIRLKGRDIHCSSTDSNLYAAIDLLIDKVIRKLTDHKTKKHQTRIVDPAKRLEMMGIS